MRSGGSARASCPSRRRPGSAAAPRRASPRRAEARSVPPAGCRSRSTRALRIDGSGRCGSTLRLVLRASDADRELALALLREASVDGRLTLEELAERAELVQAARTRDEVAAATADRGAAAPNPPEATVRQRALFSHFAREGPWRPARQSRFSAVFGSVRLDLRKAV